MSITVEDRWQLQQLVARCAIARDEMDIESLLNCFTPEARFHRRGRTVAGREDLREFFLGSMRRYDLSIHTTHNQILDPESDHKSVRGLVTGHAELVLEGSLIISSFRYRDVYHQAESQWRIAERDLKFLYTMPVGDLAFGFVDRRRIRLPGEEPVEADYPEAHNRWTAEESGSG